MRKLHLLIVMFISLGFSWSVFACEGAGENKHVGLVTQVDPGKKTFTIKDAETQSPITFTANDEIIKGLKGYTGKVLVSYEGGNKSGALKATGVTF